MTEVYDAPTRWNDKVQLPLILFKTLVRPEWIDEFGHVSNIRYLQISDHADWAFWNWINSPLGTMEQRGGHENVIVERHVRYLSELMLGMAIHVTTRLIDFDDKRYVLFQEIYRSQDNILAATVETKVLGFNLTERRVERWAPRVLERLGLVRDAQAALPKPSASGCGISLAGTRA